MNNLLIDNLIVTQHDLRHHDNILSMADYVKKGGIWSLDYLTSYAQENNFRTSPLIQISEFEDNKKFIHDGHHRNASILMAGRDFLYPEEYQITQWKYSDYLEVNLEHNWITPYDPRIECRLPNLFLWKKMANQSIVLWQDDLYKNILNNKKLYCEPRRFSSVKELISQIKSKL